MRELTATRVREHAERLHLPHLGENLDALVARAEAKTMGYLEFIDLVLEEDVGVGEGRRFANALKLSACPTTRAWTPSTSPSNPTWTPARSATWPPWGSPKPRPTSASSAHQESARPCSRSPWPSPPARPASRSTCTTLDDLVRNLNQAEASGRFAKKLQTYLKPAVLVVDEIGYLPLARADANMVFQLVARRYERGSILATSNKAFSEWGSVFGDDVLASAILDRLLHHCDVISINGPSYRLKDRLKPSNGGGALE
jgi:IstB-like ATP binding protein